MTAATLPNTDRPSRRIAGTALIGMGVAIGIAGFQALELTGAGFSLSDDLPVQTMLDKIDAVRSSALLGGGIQALIGMGIVLFGAIVRRALAQREPAAALTPTIAWGGALLTAALISSAAAMTQLAGATEKSPDPGVLLTFYNLQENLFAGAWCALALTAGAVAYAGLARGSVPRWLGAVSAFVAILLVLAQVVVPWAGWFPAMIWVLVASIGLRAAVTADAGV
jgi:hypothetical protein